MRTGTIPEPDGRAGTGCAWEALFIFFISLNFCVSAFRFACLCAALSSLVHVFPERCDGQYLDVDGMQEIFEQSQRRREADVIIVFQGQTTAIRRRQEETIGIYKKVNERTG